MTRDWRMGFLKCCLPLLLSVLFAYGAWAADAQTQPPGSLGGKNVLVLHAFEGHAPVFAQTNNGLLKVLVAGGLPLENQFFESLDLRRNPGSLYRKLLVEQLRLKYNDRRLDLIVAMYPEAVQFVLNEAATLFPAVPMIALYMPADTDPPATDSRRRIFWNADVLDFRGTLEIALKLVPAAQRVFVASGAHEVDRRQDARARVALKPWEDRLKFRYLSGLTMDETLTTLAGAPRDSVILLLPVSTDAGGKIYFSPDVAHRVSRASAAPVFGVLESSLGRGIVGGMLYSFERTGVSAGRVALEILRGGPPSANLPSILDVSSAPMFDWQELKRWNLAVDAVPRGSVLINREYTLWERYRTAVIAALFLLALQTLLIVGLVVNRGQRQRAERKLAGQLQIESLLAELSNRFVHIPASQIENEIENAQRHICDVLALDRSVLWQVPPTETGTFQLTHVHNRPENAPVPLRMDARDLFPWATEKLLRGETITLSSLTVLPAEAVRDRESFERFGSKSTVVIPLVAEGAVLGVLSFATTRAERAWPDDVVKGFRMVAEMMANAIVRARADRALQEGQARLTLAAASADARLWEVEAETERVWMMGAGRVFFGVAPDETLTLDRLTEFIHPDDREAWHSGIRQALQTGQPLDTEFRAVGADGSVHWFASQGRFQGGGAGRPGRLLGVTIDVTERKYAEERLRMSEALSTGVLASLPGQMAIMDRAGAILRANESWQELVAEHGALDPTVMAVGAAQAHAHPRVAEHAGPLIREIQNGVEAVLAGARADFRLDYAYPTRAEERWASVSVLSLQRPEGGAVLYRQDITAQQRVRLEAERLRRDLTHVGRVTIMGEMTAALAHELNQPLTAILSNAHAGERYLGQAEPPLDEIREILRDVVGDARRAGEVIQRLRSLLRKDEARFVPLDVNQLVREIAGLVHTDAILRNFTVDLDLAPGLPPVRGDRVQLQQVLLNLILNGMEAVGPHGEGQRIVIRTQLADAAVCVAVRDEGPGIPASELSRVFETFYTTKSTGMGMGLPISRSIVEAHGGRIWAENNPDRGATFSFTIPACPPEPTSG